MVCLAREASLVWHTIIDINLRFTHHLCYKTLILSYNELLHIIRLKWPYAPQFQGTRLFSDPLKEHFETVLVKVLYCKI